MWDPETNLDSFHITYLPLYDSFIYLEAFHKRDSREGMIDDRNSLNKKYALQNDLEVLGTRDEENIETCQIVHKPVSWNGALKWLFRYLIYYLRRAR